MNRINETNKEIWRDIPGFEKKYQVSNMGRVKSLNYRHTGKIQILKPGKNTKGYSYVNLCKDGKPQSYQVHRLVAQAFLPNPNNLSQVNHINEIKTDNRVDNIEWCDCKYNINYGSHNQRMAETQSIPVAQFTKDEKLVAIYYGATEAERQTGVNSSHISECCRGKLKSAGGFVWKYV